MRAFGLVGHVRANQLRSGILLAGFVVLIVALAFAAHLAFEAWRAVPGAGLPEIAAAAARGLRRSWGLAVAAAFAWIVVGLLFHDDLADAAAGIDPVVPPEAARRLRRLLEPLCIAAGLPMPRLGHVEDPGPNAFAAGLGRDDARIVVTSGLLDALDDRELAAVLAHELTHVRHDDVKLMTVAALFAGAIALGAELLVRGALRGVAGSRGGRNDGPAAAFALAGLLATGAWASSILIRLALSRRREFLADAGAVELTRDPDAMISALRRIEGAGGLGDAPGLLREAMFHDGARGFAAWLTGWLSTHPSIDARVAALTAYAGGREAPAAGFFPVPGASAAPRFGRRIAPANPWGAA